MRDPARLAGGRDASTERAGPDTASDTLALVLGIDAWVEAVQRTRKMLFAPEAMEVERLLATLQASGDPESGSASPDPARATTMPDVLEFGQVSTPNGEFGYLRIFTW